MYESPYGKSEGLVARLDKWAHELGTNRNLPWAGLGLIADLQAASAALSGKPVEVAPTMEFDL